jgi:hypothetical protein
MRPNQASEDSGAPTRPVVPELLSPLDVARYYTISENTQALWRHENRYGFRDLVIKLGSSVRYRRADLERWLDSRRVSALAGSETRGRS